MVVLEKQGSSGRRAVLGGGGGQRGGTGGGRGAVLGEQVYQFMYSKIMPKEASWCD